MSIVSTRIRVYSYYKDPDQPKNKNHSSHFNFPFEPHPSVAPGVCKEEGLRYAACTGSLISLQNYIVKMKEKKIKDFDKPLLVQIAYAVRHIHQAGRVVVANGPVLQPQNFQFSKDEKTVVLAGFKHDKEDQDVPTKTRALNMKALSELFHLILSMQTGTEKYNPEAHVWSSEPEIAKHLISEMETNYSADQVLSHPYFWSAVKKLEFFRLVWHLFKLWNNTTNPEVIRLSSHYEKKNWRNNLLAEPPEDETDKPTSRKAIKNLLRHREEISRNLLRQQGRPLPREFYSGSSAFDLLRFIRNCFVHFWDYGTENHEARKVFKNSPEGLWSFFNSKFPDLFLEIYIFAVHGNIDDLRSKLGNEFTDELAKSEDLVPEPKPVQT